MNEFVLIDAISNIDRELLEEHFKYKEKLKWQKKKSLIMKFAAAACFIAIVVIAAPNIHNLIGYNSNIHEDEMYNKTHTEFESYEKLKVIIGEDTLLENINFSNADKFKLILSHEEDDENNYSSLTFEENLNSDIFSVAIHFPPYKDKSIDSDNFEESILLNGIYIKYSDRKDGTSKAYYYIAEFEYNGCIYSIRAYGDTDNSMFFKKISELVGA